VLPSAPPRLVVCEDLPTYERAAAAVVGGARDLPILGASVGASGAWPGFIAGLERVPFDAASQVPQQARAAGLPSSTRWCVALDHPVCVAAARLLAQATGRALLVLADDEWERGLDAHLAAHEVTTLTFVVPLWRSDLVDGSQLDPRWLGRILAQARARLDRLERVAWGIMTGPDPHGLTVTVARAALATEIAADYSEAPAAVLINHAASELGSRIPPMPENPRDPGAPLQVIDARHIASGVARSASERRWSLLYFRGHGRYYCGNEGYLCGARPLRVSQSAPALVCVDGLTCANPHDGAYRPGLLAFPRIDPRSYDAQLMIIDSCSAGSWSSPDWDGGTASLGMLAFCGSASAVVCSDYTTIGTPAGHMEVLAVMRSSPTIGHAVSRLNRLRPNDVGAFPRYLLGDPEFPLGSRRWSQWCTEPLDEQRERTPECQRILARVPAGPPFARVALELGSAHQTTTYVRAIDTDATLDSVELLADDTPEVWIALDPARGPAPIDIVVETYPTPRLPPGLHEAAITTSLIVRGWSDALREAAGPLLAAAERIESVAQLIPRIRGTALASNANELQACVTLCRQAWLVGHVTAVAKVASMVEAGLWPNNLWKGLSRHRTTRDEPCPYCGTAPTLRLNYRSGAVLEREQWECVSCALIEDRPLLPIPTLRLTMPARIEAGQAVTAELSFSNETELYFAVAGALVIDRKGHDIHSPPPFVFELGPGEQRVEAVELRSIGAPGIAHRYYARAPMLINGVWMLATRPITVCNTNDSPAP
jgi:hypothetical protein